MWGLLVVTILSLPLVVAAQPPGAGGGFGAGPPDGKRVDPAEELPALAAELTDARDKVDYAAELLYPASEEFYAVVGAGGSLPKPAATLEEVNGAIADAWEGLEVKAAEERYEAYLAQAECRRVAFDVIWKDKGERAQLLAAAAAARDTLVAVRDQVKAAAAISAEAKDNLKDIVKKLKDLENSAPPGPAMADAPWSKPSMPPGFMAHLKEAEAATKRAERQITFSKDLLRKLDKML